MTIPFTLVIMGLLVLSVATPSEGVTTQWVSRVRNFSSQWSPQGWSGKQVIGPNNVYKKYGDFPHAWAPRNKGQKHEFIEFEIKTPVVVSKIETFETDLSGYIVEILAMNPSSGIWDQLYKGNAVLIEKSRIFSPTLQMKNYATNIFRIIMDCSMTKKAWCQLDAVRVTGNAGTTPPPAPPAKLIGGTCKNDNDCPMYAYCITNDKCICRSGYFASPDNTECSPAPPPASSPKIIGGACSSDDDCPMNTGCNGGDCGCKAGYLMSADGTECY